MPITRLNHAVLFVADLEASVGFYERVLGFRNLGGRPGAAFLQAAGSTNDHDLGLFAIGSQAGPSGAGRSTVGLYHLAWEVDTLEELDRIAGKREAERALVGATDHGTTKALYGRDPNGIEFEVCWLVPADLIDDATRDAKMELRRLDLAAEKERYGATTKGGVGVSIPA